jgi:preprotein translocase subunit SecB
MTEAEKSSFSFTNFTINECSLDFTKERSKEINIEFDPAGNHYPKSNKFILFLNVRVNNAAKEQLIEIKTESSFQFSNNLPNLMTFFTLNAPAIIFPYLRAFISSLSVQSGHKPILIPTLNLSGIAKILESNIKIIEEESVQA